MIFSLTAANINGKLNDGNQANNNADCGFKLDTSTLSTEVSGGAAIGLAVVSFFLAAGQAVCFFMGRDEGNA